MIEVKNLAEKPNTVASLQKLINMNVTEREEVYYPKNNSSVSYTANASVGATIYYWCQIGLYFNNATRPLHAIKFYSGVAGVVRIGLFRKNADGSHVMHHTQNYTTYEGWNVVLASALTFDYSGITDDIYIGIHNQVAGGIRWLTSGGGVGNIWSFRNDNKYYVIDNYHLGAMVISYTNTKFSFAETPQDEVWKNNYRHILDGTTFKSKLLAGDSDVNILLIGDSFLAGQSTATSINEAEKSVLPPMCQRNHIHKLLWENIVKNKPQYDRFDSAVSPFTQSGVFIQAGSVYPGIWDDTIAGVPWYSASKNTGEEAARLSLTAGAYVEFGWSFTNFEKLNFIHRKCAANDAGNFEGVNGVTISVSTGNLKAEVWNGSAWVEANGYVFSQYLAQDAENVGNAWQMNDVKLKMRRKSGVTGSAVIRMTRTGDNTAGYMYYWGTERWNGNSVFITNIARGAFNTEKLNKNILNDVGGRDCDLVIFQLPLTNEFTAYSASAETAELNNIEYFIQGGSGDWRDTVNLKTISSDWANFQLICIVPHVGGYFISNVNKNTFLLNRAQKTSYQVWQSVKNRLTTLGVKYIDMDNNLIREAQKRGWTLYDAFSLSGTYPEASRDSFVTDYYHPNDFGCMMYAKYIAPIFDV